MEPDALALLPNCVGQRGLIHPLQCLLGLARLEVYRQGESVGKSGSSTLSSKKASLVTGLDGPDIFVD